MRGHRFRRIGAILVTVGGLAVIVALATGEVALVTTHGISMEPRFHTGDLAVIVPAAQYRVGDIVGYHSPLLHIVVLHRIVSEHAGLFTFKGDNNSFLDPTKLPASAIKGRLWLHIPGGGIVLSWVRSPVVIGFLAFLVVALGIGGASRRLRARGPAAGPGSGSGPRRAAPSTVGVGWWPIAVAMTFVAAFGLLTMASLVQPSTRPSESSLSYGQHVTFSYTGTAPAGVTYPAGTVTTGDPVFLHLVNTITVGVHYDLEPGAQRRVSSSALAVGGTIGATATLRGPGGWSGQLAAVAPVDFSGASAQIDVPLDLAQISALERTFLFETGVPIGDPEIVVSPVVHVHGTMAGTALRDSFGPSLAFDVEGQYLNVLGTSASGNGASTPQMSDVSSGSVEHRIFVPARMSILGRSVPVVDARRLGLGGLALSILAVLGACVWRMRRRRMDETARIHAAYGHDLVAVAASPAAKAPLVVDLETFGELARLARRYDCVILEHVHDQGHAYYVESGATLYRCGVEDPEPAPVSADSADDRSPVSVGTGPADDAVVPAAATVVRGARRRLRSSASPTDPDTARIADDVDVLTLLAKAEWVSGVGDARAHLREAVVLARKAELHQPMIEALLVNVRTSFGRDQESDPEKIELLEYSLGLPGVTPACRARLLGALAVESIFVEDSTQRGPVLDEARELAFRSAEPLALVEVTACDFVGRPRSMWSARQFTLDRPLFHQALDAALTIGDPAGVATAQTHAALCALIAGDGEDLRAQAVALSGTSAGGQNQIALRSHLLVGQTLATLEGRLADAEELSAEASEGRRVTGITDTDRAAAIAQFALRREQERLHELIPALTADAASPPAAAAFALMETGHRDDAAILLHRAGHAGFSDIPDDVDWPVAAALWSEVAARIGDRHAAAELYEILRPHDGIQLCSGGVACGPASRVLALVEVLLGRPADADRHFAEAIAFSRELMSPVWMARCQLDWAQTWLDRGETAWAAQLTDAADETAGALALPALGRQWATLRDQLDRT